MTYNFDKPTLRRGTNSVKWDDHKEEDIIPLWVADMDFEVAPAIIDALRNRVEHKIFGYTHVPDAYYEAIVSWFARRHQWTIRPEWIIYTSGVIPAMSAIMKAITMPGENILIATPVYNHFYSAIRNNGCQALESKMLLVNNRYEIDWDDFEAKAAEPKTTMYLLCNPHNPAGRVWTEDELRRMYDICKRHGVRVVSDEIHCELTKPGLDYVPFGRLSEEISSECIVMNSPSKSWNIAGLQIANIVCQDDELRRRIDRAININEVCDVNPFGVLALQAAYNQSEDWLDEARAYIYNNYMALRDFLAARMPHITAVEMEGTYLAWVDIRATGMTSLETEQRLMDEARVRVSGGHIYSARDGEGYIRVNLACPRARLLEGLERMVPVLKKE